MKKLILASCVLVLSIGLCAQGPNLDTVKQQLYNINKVFDSARYLGFDVNIRYSSDTILGKIEFEEMNGQYILNDKNLHYRMGHIEYTQNDSFSYNIYHDEKTLMMTQIPVASKSSLFPLKNFVDSIIKWYDTSYTITLETGVEDQKGIVFTAKKDSLPYSRFAVYYDSTNYYPDRFEMSFYDGYEQLADVPDSIAAMIRVRKPPEKRLVMSFTNYHNPPSLDMFENAYYVYFDRIRKKYRPSARMKDYRFLTNGVNGDEFDENIELYPPPQEQ